MKFSDPEFLTRLDGAIGLGRSVAAHVRKNLDSLPEHHRNPPPMPTGTGVAPLREMLLTRSGSAKVKVVLEDLGETPVLRGAILRSKGGETRVAVNKTMSNCWIRFVVTKELFHLVLDKTDDDFATEALVMAKSVVKNEDLNGRLTSDKLAQYCALEYLMPYGMRPAILTADGPSTMDIAKEFLVPEAVVDFLYDVDQGYWKKSAQANEMFDAQG